MTTYTDSDPVSLPLLMSEISKLISECASETEALEKVLEDIHDGANSGGRDPIVAFQKLDFLRQIQTDLSAFLDAIGSSESSAEPTTKVDLAKFLPVIQLGELRSRFSHLSDEVTAESVSITPTQNSGEIEMF